MTSEVPGKKRRELLNQSVLTALMVGVGFLLVGKFVFELLGIKDSDFLLGGGIILLVISVQDIVSSKIENRRQVGDHVGVVPIGIPLIMGPAGLTTLLALSKSYGYIPVLAALVINLVIVWFAFRYSQLIIKVVGEGGAKAIGKVASLIMAAIAVKMLRVGLQEIF